MRPLQSICLCLMIGTGVCDSPARPDGSVAGGAVGSAVQQVREGVAGRVTGENGTAIEGASILAAALDPDAPPVPELAIVSDAKGRYEWPLRPGRYELTVVADGYQRTARKTAVTAGVVTTVDFVLSRSR